MKKVMLVTPMLHQGGFERICALTAELLKDQCSVSVVVFTKADMFYDVPGVELIDLELGAVNGKLPKLLNLIKRARKLGKLSEKYGTDVMYSFGQTANTACVLAKTRAKKLAAIHSFGEIQNAGYMSLMRKRADEVLCCSKAVAREAADKSGIRQARTVWNPCDIEEIVRLGGIRPDRHTEFFETDCVRLISMGREDDVKGYWHLIRVFKSISEEQPHTRLVILGEGTFAEYRELCGELGIQDRVLFAGMQKNPFWYLKNSDVYVLSSISEGLPNALVEALALGLPVVSANCRSGPAEILAAEWTDVRTEDAVYMAEYGILTPPLSPRKSLKFRMEDNRIVLEKEEQRMKEGILRMITDRELYENYSSKGNQRSRDFSVEAYTRKIMECIGD